MKKNIIVVAAHPDDEVLGCGATIAKYAARGDLLTVIFLADGESARGKNSRPVSERQRAAKRACSILGANAPVFLNFPDNKLDCIPLLEVIQSLEEQLLPLSPDIIYTHHGGDLNIDHQITHRAVLTACRPQPGISVKAIYTFEILSSTGWSSLDLDPGFRPLHFVDVSDTFEKKLTALKIYDSELRDFPHARSLQAITALAEIRGSLVGLNKAEGFGIVRQIEK